MMTLRVAAVCAVLASASAQAAKMKLLNDGHSMPSISLGTCCGSKPDVGLPLWLQAGGMGIDTSIDYHDETNIGAILKQEKIPREKVYITTKVTAGCGKTPDCGADASIALASVNESLKNLGVDYIDMILLHRPCEQLEQKCSIAAKLTNCSGPTPLTPPEATKANNALWAGLMQAKKAGLVKSIGVSNYFPGQLAALEGDVPAINQCEMSIQGYDNATIKYCQEKGIVYESYGAMRGCPFTDPDLGAIAAAHKVSPAQVCLRWVLQHGAVIASGTGSNATTAGAYSKENLGVFDFELSAAEMMKLNDKQL